MIHFCNKELIGGIFLFSPLLVKPKSDFTFPTVNSFLNSLSCLFLYLQFPFLLLSSPVCHYCLSKIAEFEHTWGLRAGVSASPVARDSWKLSMLPLMASSSVQSTHLIPFSSLIALTKSERGSMATVFQQPLRRFRAAWPWARNPVP